MQQPYIVIFDGVCHFCNASVNFIIRHDPFKKFVFTPAQSTYARALLDKHHIQEITNDTFVLIKSGKAYTRSRAAIEIAKDLSGLWPVLALLVIIPAPIRDFFYSWIAKNRYRWFGKRDSCIVPTQDVKDRFKVDHT